MRVREVERIGRLEQEGVESYHLQGLETEIWSVPRGESWRPEGLRGGPGVRN